jgi:DNA repair exonuclease SbcCD nuclease subunit
MRFIHSSDIHIGKAFGYFEPEVETILREARQLAIRKLGELAMKHRASCVLLAGDIYDRQQLSPVTLRRPIESMGQFPRIAWHLMPGNHDRVRENGLWDRIRRSSTPENVHLHVDPGPVKITDDDGLPVFLLPAPLTLRSSTDDNSAYMDNASTPESAIRIGLAHGSVQGFGTEGEAANYVSPARPEQAGLAYLAMGDWHRQNRISDRVWYSGTPEPDQFRRPDNAPGTLCNGGSALLVEIASATAVPQVTPFDTGTYRWHAFERTLIEGTEIASLEAELRALEPDLATVVLDLTVAGTISLAARRTFEERIRERLRAAIQAMRLDDSRLVLEPTELDLDEIDHSGFVREAANRLKLMAEDKSDPAQARLAAVALRRLYLEHLRQSGQP